MKDIESIGEFVGKLYEISIKLVVLGENMEEFKFVKKFLSSLFRKRYIYRIVSFERIFDFKTINFKDITGYLKIYEECICEEEEEY